MFLVEGADHGHGINEMLGVGHADACQGFPGILAQKQDEFTSITYPCYDFAVLEVRVQHNST